MGRERRFLGLSAGEWIFLARFAGLFSIPYLGMRFSDLAWLTSPVAGAEGFLLNALGLPSSMNDSIITLAGKEYEIIPDCTGLVMIIMLFALLWSTPVKQERKWFFMAFGAPFLLAFNLLRLALTIWMDAVLGVGEGAHVVFWLVDAGAVVGMWAKAAELW